MKKVCFIGILLAVLGFATLANANLVNNGNGLIYDTDLDITWYDGPPVTGDWGTVNTWANNLEVTVGGITYDDWRLPTTPGSSFGFRHEGEMAYLYYEELHNVEYGPLDKGPYFLNLQAAKYWTGTDALWMDSIPPYDYACTFSFANGWQAAELKEHSINVMAVHAGNVGAVPIPGAIFLFAPGLLGLAVLRRRLKK
jgi:hypothetical protein